MENWHLIVVKNTSTHVVYSRGGNHTELPLASYLVCLVHGVKLQKRPRINSLGLLENIPINIFSEIGIELSSSQINDYLNLLFPTSFSPATLFEAF